MNVLILFCTLLIYVPSSRTNINYLLNDENWIMEQALNEIDSTPDHPNFPTHHNSYQTNFLNDQESRIYGLTFDSEMPFPRNSLISLGPTLIIPFIPTGIFQLRLPIFFNINRLIAQITGSSTSRSFAADQLEIFQGIENLLSNTFSIDGKACLQRIICEISEYPIIHRSFLGFLLQSFLEPQRGSFSLMSDYVEAQRKGINRENCWKSYGRCPFTLENILSSPIK